MVSVFQGHTPKFYRIPSAPGSCGKSRSSRFVFSILNYLSVTFSLLKSLINSRNFGLLVDKTQIADLPRYAPGPRLSRAYLSRTMGTSVTRGGEIFLLIGNNYDLPHKWATVYLMGKGKTWNCRTQNSSVIIRVWDFALAFWVQKLFGTFEKRVPGL